MQKINILLTFLLVAIVLYACGNTKENKTASTSPIDSLSLDTDKLKAYQSFLNQLDTNEMTNISKAAEYFTTSFKGTSTNTNDSAYSLFNSFHWKVNFRVEENLILKDMEKYFEVINDKIDNAVKPTVNKIQQSGFRFGITEGSIYISPDFAFQRKHFFEALSPAMQTYFAQEEKEDQEGYADDGGLVVEPKIIAERIVFWEKFDAQYPQFRWKSKVKHSIKNYTSVIFNGMDNSPIFYENQLDSAYLVAYQFLKKENAQTEIGKQATQYLDLLEKNKGKDSPDAKDFRTKIAPWE